MKKLLSFLALALPMMFALSSCDDDNKLPNVDITVNLEGVTRVDNTLYLVKDEPLQITGISLTDNDGKGAVIGAATYYWDYYRVGGSVVAPYGITIDTEGIPVGTHLLQINMSIYAVDYSAAYGWIEYNVVIVDNESDIPTQGTVERNPAVKAVIRTAELNK